MKPGDRVTDTEDQDEGDTMIVVGCPDRTISEHVIDSDGLTVADVNDGYPDDDPVVSVVFESLLEDIEDAWDVATVESLQYLVDDEGLKTYAYPESRLEVQTPADDVVTVRRTEDGNRYVHRLQVTHVGDSLVFGDDFDGVDHQYGTSRPVCFNRPEETQLAEGNHLTVEYKTEKDIGDEYPPLLAGVEKLTVKEESASPDYLFDL
jgi:hypothetical protein